jgi:ComF family protein
VSPAKRAPGPRVGFAASMSHAILAFLFPDACLFCDEPLGRSERHLCARCRDGLEPSLRRVAPPSPADLAGRDDGTYFVLPFDGPARALVHALKYGGRTSIASELAALALPAARELVTVGICSVVAVPLHRVRLRERGFNQSALVAREVARGLGVAFRPALERTRATRSQTVLSREERTRNVAGAFRAEGTCEGRRILLVDDVVTTGATLRAATVALLAAGAFSVTRLAIAGDILDHRGDGGGRPDATPKDPETG